MDVLSSTVVIIRIINSGAKVRTISDTSKFWSSECRVKFTLTLLSRDNVRWNQILEQWMQSKVHFNLNYSRNFFHVCDATQIYMRSASRARAMLACRSALPLSQSVATERTAGTQEGWLLRNEVEQEWHVNVRKCFAVEVINEIFTFHSRKFTWRRRQNNIHE